MIALLAVLAAALAAVLYLLAAARACAHASAADLVRIQTDAAALRDQLSQSRAAAAALQAELRASEEKHGRLQETFAALSKEALDANSAHVLRLTEQVLKRAQESSQADLEKRAQAVAEMVRPVHESLHQVGEKIHQLEKSQEGNTSRLAEQVRTLAAGEERLRGETARLATALRAPAQRGRWGETQLRRTVELAGLRAHVDFDEQPVASSDEGVLRPDMAVKLPGNKTVLIDSKVPFEAYDRAILAPEIERPTLLKAHAAQLRAHVEALSRKQYWEAFPGSPEMVVLFVPSEGLLAAALDADPQLDADAFKSRIVLATPSTLLSILLTVAHVWKQESIALHAREIARHGRELHKRIATLAVHIAKLGRALGSATASYNEVVGSFESRVLPGARKFEELKAAAADVEIEPLPELETRPRLPAPALEDIVDEAN
ncbi:MAG TPA: DNA recombination protein RmuC [Myxococcales bacterium]